MNCHDHVHPKLQSSQLTQLMGYSFKLARTGIGPCTFSPHHWTQLLNMKDDCVICKPAGKNESTSSLRGSKWGPEGFIWMVVEAQGKGMKPNNNAAVLPVPTTCCLSNGIVIARNDWAKIYLSKVQRVKSHEISHCSSIRCS